MSMTSIRLPLWLRFVLIAGVAILAAGAGLLGYRYYTHPVTLTVAVGSIDGEAAKAMSAIASRLVTINAPVRLTVDRHRHGAGSAPRRFPRARRISPSFAATWAICLKRRPLLS